MCTTRLQGVPSHFRYSCADAETRGGVDYSDPAWHLAIHLEGLVPYDSEPEVWYKAIADLVAILDGDGTDDQVWAWFVEHCPACMELVPMEAKTSFVKGIGVANDDGRI